MKPKKEVWLKLNELQRAIVIPEVCYSSNCNCYSRNARKRYLKKHEKYSSAKKWKNNHQRRKIARRRPIFDKFVWLRSI